MTPTLSSVEPKKIFEQANGFCQALAILCNVEPTNIKLGITIGEPVMVVAAFTIELFFKCMIGLETGEIPRRTHHLRRLFDRLSKPIQLQIQAEWNEIATYRQATWDDYEKALGIKMARDLPSALAAGAEAFLRIRYSYEGGSENFQFYLMDLPQALGRIVLRLKPEWKDHEREYRPLHKPSQ